MIHEMFLPVLGMLQNGCKTKTSEYNDKNVEQIILQARNLQYSISTQILVTKREGIVVKSIHFQFFKWNVVKLYSLQPQS